LGGVFEGGLDILNGSGWFFDFQEDLSGFYEDTGWFAGLGIFDDFAALGEAGTFGNTGALEGQGVDPSGVAPGAADDDGIIRSDFVKDVFVGPTLVPEDAGVGEKIAGEEGFSFGKVVEAVGDFSLQ